MAFMTVKNAKVYQTAHTQDLRNGGNNYATNIDLTQLLTAGQPKVIYRPSDIQTEHVHSDSG